ncbi:hypothetical protein [Enterovirga rhinocerotis]|uniref:Uncharacterized protein n=1 Tax=Enterovirga rhinocerotis TaxID=1339210 RepID=A0A4R7C8K0_9HYPH|nr:hypothetical protein [Enterovirga rhinocerotis]TDR93176.1 hypothetical protein EV668_0431 [Enterovirga rhinocerotis]
MRPAFAVGCLAILVASVAPAFAEPPARLEVVWPKPGMTLTIGDDRTGVVGVVVASNFDLKPAGQCGSNPRCGHLHMKIDPEGDRCNQPGRAYNSMNSDWGGDLIKAHFGFCEQPVGRHVIGVLLADDQHRPVLVDGKPVTALVPVDVRR